MSRLFRNERGATIVEATATLAVLSVVLVFLFGSLWAILRAVSGNERRLENLGEARTIMNALTKDVRTATRLQADGSPFVLADEREMIFFANINPTTGPKRVRLYVDAQTRLVEQVILPDAGSCPDNCTYSGVPTIRMVGEYVANGPGNPLFNYYDSAGNLLPTPLSASDMLAVKAVQIVLSIRKENSIAVPGTTLINRVRLPNIDYNPIPSPSP